MIVSSQKSADVWNISRLRHIENVFSYNDMHQLLRDLWKHRVKPPKYWVWEKPFLTGATENLNDVSHR
jgi:hypothetical protein